MSDRSVDLAHRIDALESSVAEMQRTIRDLEQAVASQRVPQLTPVSSAPSQQTPVPGIEGGVPASVLSAPPHPPAQVFCANCGGGNPPGAPYCMWCHRPLVAGAAGTVQPGALPPPPPPPPARAAAQPATFNLDFLGRGEFWLNKVGIGLLLLGLAFLFKYSIDQGWLTPWVRIVFGLALGTALIVLGLRLSPSRRNFRQVLLGGGIASFYITGYAAYQLLSLVQYEVAFGFMVLTTVLAFALSLRQSAATLTVIGAIGGFATPFLLYTGKSNTLGLVAYACLILLGAGAVYFFRGWISVLWTSFIGFWIVTLAAEASFTPGATSDQWAVQTGIALGWLAFWLLPLVRLILARANPERWRDVLFDNALTAEQATFNGALSIVGAALLSAPLTALTWSLSGYDWGWILLGGAVLYGLAYQVLRPRVSEVISGEHAVIALILFTAAMGLILRGDALILALVIEAAVLHLWGATAKERSVATLAHLLFLWPAGLLLWRLASSATGTMPFFNWTAITDLVVIGLIFASSFLQTSRQETLVYRLVAHIAVLWLLWRELAALPNGNGYITLAWGAYGIGLLLAGVLLNRNRSLLTVALATLFLVVAKLLLVDLAALDAVWRILMFLGFGGLFLVLSYYFQRLVGRAPEQSSTDSPAT
jgi:uncharacterized membrane protein